MGDLIFMNKEAGGLYRFLESGFSADRIKKGEDFEVVSMIVLDKEWNHYSLGDFLGKKSNDIFEGHRRNFLDVAQSAIENEGKSEDIITVFETRYPEDAINLGFYKLRCEIDIDLATEVGLGVIRYKDDYMLYSPFFGQDPTDVVYELMMFKVYFQLLHPEIIDEGLKAGFIKNQDIIQAHMLLNVDKHMFRLAEILR